LDLSRTLFIGDDVRDAQAADAAGCPAALVTGDVSLLDITRGVVGGSFPSSLSCLEKNPHTSLEPSV
jgi:hypothetical protein